MTPANSTKLRNAPIRRPVRRHNAQRYLLLLLISFSTTVIVTRLFLTLTGFPKIGNGELHIAHLLWGGLALFISTIIMLVLTNQWAFTLVAILGGVGSGLFIDEIGKFITQSNDYFYPLAIPIIYAFALVMILIYLEARRPESLDERAEMYRSLEMFKELLDRDLNPSELEDLQTRLKNIAAQSAIPDITRLAQTLLGYLSSGAVQIVPDHRSFIQQLATNTRQFLTKRLGNQRLRIILIIGFMIAAVVALYDPITLFFAPQSPVYFQNALEGLIKAGQIRGVRSLDWYLVRLAIEGTIGLVLIVTSVLFLTGRNKRASEIGYIGLLLSLTMVNLLVFYFDQFGNIFMTLWEVGLLLLLLHYRDALKAVKAS